MSPEKEKTKADDGKTGISKVSRKAADFIPNTPGAAADSLSVQVDDPAERRYFRRALLVIGGAVLVMLFFFTVFFFLAVRGAEKTVIPNIVEKDLVEALVILQERELYPRVQVKYTGDPSDKGMVIDQDPEPGLYVKAGRRVIVTVSKGAIVDNVEDYVGKNLNDVRSRLASLFSTFKPLLVIREPVTYVYDDSEPGTVLSQAPQAGTPLGEPEDLILIVSRGSLDKPVKIPDWENYSADNAMRSLARIPLPFIFVEDNVSPSGTVARVTSQFPPPESEVGLDRTITLGFSRPESWPEEFRYGLFDYTLPAYPVPVLLEVIVREPGTEDRKLFSMPHSGGEISFPYVVPVGTGIVVMVNGKEVAREDISAE
ncbi:MAG: penicillin-binding protein [Spirochaetes bacterium]|nr:MAG: penicillin-binding protein [Spirochaetota bacterium]RKX87718.1 MAG: penicillin-binding protein [Spirochaetota bacterium]RKX98663.1 MAG: penicillin-binding protein [Spirochaetota bacterium]